MKNLILLTTLLFILHASIFGQRSAYYDALFLKSIVDSPVFSNHFTVNIQTREIFDFYYPNLNDGEIDAAIKANPFLKPYYITNDGTMSTKELLGVKTPGLLSSIGGLDVTNFSQGLSLFLIDRAKQELNIAFFDKFKKFTEDNPEIGILFPNTTYCLANLLAYQYSQMLPVLQEAFYKDLGVIPQNLVEVLLMPKYYEKIKAFPEFLVIVNSIGLLQHIDNFSPPELIDTLPSIADFDTIQRLANLHNSLKLASVFSNAIRTDSIHFIDSLKNYWVSPKDFYKNIISDSVTFNIFLGLIYQKIQIKGIIFNNDLLTTKIKNNERELWWYKMQFSKLLTQVDNVSISAKSITRLKAEGKNPTKNDIYCYINTTIELFEFGNNIASHYYKSITADKYIALARNVNGLYINTVSQDYALSMNNLISIFNSFNDIYNKADKRKAKKLVTSELTNDNIKVQSVVTLSTEIDKSDTDPTTKIIALNAIQKLNTDTINIASLEDSIMVGEKIIFKDNLISGITTYGTFIANMTDADTPQEVQAAIENAALPAGSSSFKKNYKNNIALNAYLGVNAGNWPKDTSSNTWNNDFRLTAPIGITYTPCSWGKRGSLSVFASLLDVGAIVDYQLSTDGKEVEQKIYLSNIFSPGGYIVYGMAWNLPISVGFGGQYGPGLVKMGEDIWNPSWRWNIFLGVDIPIFNLYKGRGIAK